MLMPMPNRLSFLRCLFCLVTSFPQPAVKQGFSDAFRDVQTVRSVAQHVAHDATSDQAFLLLISIASTPIFR